MNVAMFGRPVIVGASMPEKQAKISLSRNIVVGHSFRCSFNKWLSDQFGWEYVAYEIDGKIVVGPKVYARLKQL